MSCITSPGRSFNGPSFLSASTILSNRGFSVFRFEDALAFLLVRGIDFLPDVRSRWAVNRDDEIWSFLCIDDEHESTAVNFDDSGLWIGLESASVDEAVFDFVSGSLRRFATGSFHVTLYGMGGNNGKVHV
jgi:hypothetical protein